METTVYHCRPRPLVRHPARTPRKVVAPLPKKLYMGLALVGFTDMEILLVMRSKETINNPVAL
jgi:hypothetical protein